MKGVWDISKLQASSSEQNLQITQLMHCWKRVSQIR